MIAIVKYNAGNIGSVQNALARLGADCIITDDQDKLRVADKVIFPGVGEAKTAMQYLRERNLDSVILSLNQPVLGICLGLQLLCNHSEENDTDCLSVFDAEVKKFPAEDIVPHMGWNNLQEVEGELLKGVSPADDLYFVHSYYAEICKYTIASCTYIIPFSAALQKDNFYATQFHPEKSGKVGEQILKNFIAL